MIHDSIQLAENNYRKAKQGLYTDGTEDPIRRAYWTANVDESYAILQRTYGFMSQFNCCEGVV